MDKLVLDGKATGGWKAEDTSRNNRNPIALEADNFGQAIAQKQREMAARGTMTPEESRAQTTTWYGIEKGDNLWSMSEKHLEAAWGRQASQREIAAYWRQVCKDNPFEASTGSDSLIHEGRVAAFRAPGADPKKPVPQREPDKTDQADSTDQTDKTDHKTDQPQDPNLTKLQDIAKNNPSGLQTTVDNYARTGDPSNNSTDVQPTYDEVVARTKWLSDHADKIPGVLNTIVPATHELIGDAMIKEYADLTLGPGGSEEFFREYLDAIGNSNKDQQVDGAIEVHRYLTRMNQMEHARLVILGAEKAGVKLPHS